MTRVDVYDLPRRDWRVFSVVPADPAYVPHCANGLHQLDPRAVRCACGTIYRGTR